MLSALIAMWITHAFWLEQPQIEFHLWNMIFLVLKEFMVGMAIGFSANTVFWAAKYAGGIIDFDMGYHTQQMFNQDNAPTLVGELKNMAVLMLFIIIGGPNYIIEGLFASFRAVPINTFEITGSTVQLLIKLITTVFIIGIKIASPILVALFLTNLSLALLARVAPQTNIFILSFQLKITIGLLVLMASVPLFVYVAKYSLEGFQEEMMRIILSLNPTRV